MTLTAKVEMSKELKGLFDNLEKNIQRNIATGALRAGAKVIKNEAVNLVPKDTGGLKSTIRHGVSRDKKTGNVYGYIRAGGKKFGVKTSTKNTVNVAGQKGRVKVKEKVVKADAFYAHFVEYGTQAHKIPHGRVRILSKKKDVYGNIVKTKGIKNPRLVMKTPWGLRTGPFLHGGSRARPYMRPALDRKRAEAQKAMLEYIFDKLPMAILRQMPFEILDAE